MRDNIENKILHNILDPVINCNPKHVKSIGVKLKNDALLIGSSNKAGQAVGEVVIKIARLMEFIDLVFEKNNE